MSGIFGISITGLRAAQVGLATTGHNITNADTAGFHRQEIVQNPNIPVYTGAGYIGQGANVETVKRVYNQFLDLQVQTAQTRSSYLDTYSAQINQIDNMLADVNAGMSPALQQFFQGVQDVAANPASVPSRQSMISSAEVLVGRLQTLNGRLEEIREGVDAQIFSTVGVINSYGVQIADLNSRIVLAEAGGNGQPPNDLYDQRDQLIADLNKEVNVTVVKQDGSYNVFMGQGQALVIGQQSFNLTAMPSPDDPERMEVAYVTSGGNMFLARGVIDGGNLGGLLGFRAEGIDAVQNGIGLVATGLAQTFNDQHSLGQDLNGALGTNFFNVAAPKVITNSLNNAASGSPTVTMSNVSNMVASDYTLAKTAAGYTLTRLSDNTVTNYLAAAFPLTVDGLTITAPAPVSTGDRWMIEPTRNGARDISVAIHDTAKIAAAAPIIAEEGGTNTGTGVITPGVVNTPPPADVNLQQAVTITFHSPADGQFDVSGVGTGNPANVVYTAGGNITYNGWTVQISGAPGAGDVFTIGPNTNGVADNRNALLLAGLQTEPKLSGGTASYQSVYSQIVSAMGVKSRDINVMGKAQAALVAQSTQAQQSMSGVNLDEEAANLLHYQQAYQASGKMMQIATTLFDTLLSLGS